MDRTLNLRKQPSFFAHGPSGVSRNSRETALGAGAKKDGCFRGLTAHPHPTFPGVPSQGRTSRLVCIRGSQYAGMESELRKADRTVIYFPIFRQARPGFFRVWHGMVGREGEKNNDGGWGGRRNKGSRPNFRAARLFVDAIFMGNSSGGPQVAQALWLPST